ncbi:EamA family transporter [Alicyclobacillus vulcanalis]|uniref:Threonine/homoserine efflux transporter RhtA n=1 Tax=Alicyclobacillus vulcanalis TaxID=252246 RepID=A0A1N7KVN5_9BACL|nr:DMT family transporter [Alicyclobacillus vulcanalis]SIS65702.1 Threonine/homoserine efflux transporter RhtA [Alicyclobacillus vulcanalis]
MSESVAIARLVRSFAQSDRFRRFRGIGLALLGSILWGISGTAAQVLFNVYRVDPAWLVAVRMSLAGIILLGASGVTAGRRQTLAPWRRAYTAVRTVLFGLAGLLGVQYTYFASIHAGNAATATVLQYMAPIVILAYAAARSRRVPSTVQLACAMLAMMGCVLLVTDGHLERLAVSGWCVLWGLLSAVAVAVYSIFPVSLLAEFGPMVVTAWGMMVGGAAIGVVVLPRHPLPHLLPGAWFLVGFVVVFGTVVPFYLYLASLRDITPADASIVASGEPLSATALAVTALHQPMTWAALLGMACVLATVTLLARTKS